MECKSIECTNAINGSVIRIVPEWNVNIQATLKNGWTGTIRIVPEWNVNEFKADIVNHLIDKNSTRMECKLNEISYLS